MTIAHADRSPERLSPAVLEARRRPAAAAEQVREYRHKLGLDRTAFARALGLGPRGYAQVRKWEEGVGEPSAAALTAMRLLVELKQERELPWMTPEMWNVAQNALDGTQNTLGRARSMDQRRLLTSMVQLLRALLARHPR